MKLFLLGRTAASTHGRVGQQHPLSPCPHSRHRQEPPHAVRGHDSSAVGRVQTQRRGSSGWFTSLVN